ncbi:baseplate J/gp47 family protein [Helicobacter cappadocius]|uniref:Baseplate J/gp47 family protein n=1 Tax=Helicobacter cappadocius TaxID=3063998 RepID=A0AA90Q0D4_9HELI|nr:MULTISPECIES: baseplate J/gp47 family protein [unclassified Helicobacter]MDO7253887.1 baseplate J/gp47 family protein [Helicobacter sp. faydin-H75]MDP2539748.1 baseplate J/gp47 family protein [Helicobacter sp. faydin-H76]
MNLPQFLIPCDIEAERNIILDELREKLPDYEPLRGDDFNILLDCFLYRLNKYINYINYIISQNYLPHSSGEFLDCLVSLAGIKRFEGTPFNAEIEITSTFPLSLPKGTKFNDHQAHNAFLSEDLKIDESLKARANITLEEGLQGDFDTIYLEIPHIYIKTIKKISPFTQEKIAESDDELKKRFLLSLTRPSTAGSLKSYEYLASVASVAKSKIKHKDLGVVEVVYTESSSNALADLKESIEPNIPITDNIIYTKAHEILVDLTINLKLKTSQNIINIIKNIDLQIRGLFESLEIEEDLNISKIIAVSFVSEDIEDIEVSTLLAMEENSIYKLGNLEIKEVI